MSDPRTVFHYGPVVPRDGAPIAYVAFPKAGAAEAVSVAEPTARPPENSFAADERTLSVAAGDMAVRLDRSRFLLADRFSGGVPLYWKHVLGRPHYAGASSAQVMVEDADGVPVETSLWLYDPDANAVYHALGESAAPFFVVYAAADDAGAMLDPARRELLGTGPAFRPADAAAFAAGRLDPAADAYVVVEDGSRRSGWRLYLPRPAKYALRYLEESVMRPTVAPCGDAEPWRLDVRDTVVKTVQARTGEPLEYRIVESARQDYYPFPPLRRFASRRAAALCPTVVALGTGNVVVTAKTPLEIVVHDASGRVLRALTTDALKAGRSLLGAPWEVDAYRSVDLAGGRIQLGFALPDGALVDATFCGSDGLFRYDGLNLNPAYDPAVVERTFAILCAPFVDGLERAIHHVAFGPDGTAVDASDAELLAWCRTAPRTMDDLGRDWLYCPGTWTDNDRNWLLLGAVSVGLPYDASAATAVDLRRRGGGVDPALLPRAVEAMPGCRGNWDVGCWDGADDPLAASIVVFLPSGLRTIVDEATVADRISPFLQCGVRTLVRWYDDVGRRSLDCSASAPAVSAAPPNPKYQPTE